MATNPKKSSKTKASGAKRSVKSKSAPKPAQEKAASPAKKTAIKPKTVAKAQQKNIQPEKKSAQTSAAFEKKIDQMAKSADTGAKSGSKMPVAKIIIAAIIIFVLAVAAYIFYPVKRSSTVTEDVTPKEEPPAVPAAQETAPAHETKIAEPEKKDVKPASDAVIHKVKYKDRLTEISKQYYGSHKEWKRIYEANKDKINNPNLIFPGQEFIIPGVQKKD